MTEALPFIEKSETCKGVNGMILETKYCKVQGKTLTECKKIFKELAQK